MKRLTILRHFLTAALVVAAAASVTACGKKAPGKPAVQHVARAVRVAVIEPHDMTGGLTAAGVLVSREEAVVSSELAGYRVARVMADVQQYVRQGQPLVILDDTLLRSQIAQQEANAALAQDEANRVKGLDNAGVLSAEAISQRRYQAKAAEAVLNDLRVRASRMVIRAPVSGLVMERTVRPGDISGGGTPMMRIIRGNLVELEADVPEAQLGALRPGSAAQVVLPNSQTTQGAVRFISPAVDPNTKLGKVRIALPVRADLRPGGFARAVFTGLSRSALAVPETAVRYTSEGPTVMTLDATNHVGHAIVRTGQHNNGWVELVEGPPAGARVLLGGSVFVLDGDVVRPIEGDAPTAVTANGKAIR